MNLGDIIPYIAPTVVLLLNMLIALQADTYDRVQEKATCEFLRERARVVLDFELFMSEKERKDRRLFPQFIHILVPTGDVGVDGRVSTSAGAHRGRLDPVKDKIAELAETQERRMRELEGRMNEKFDLLARLIRESGAAGAKKKTD